jgi:hypothetical protein
VKLIETHRHPFAKEIKKTILLVGTDTNRNFRKTTHHGEKQKLLLPTKDQNIKL